MRPFEKDEGIGSHVKRIVVELMFTAVMLLGAITGTAVARRERKSEKNEFMHLLIDKLPECLHACLPQSASLTD